MSGRALRMAGGWLLLAPATLSMYLLGWLPGPLRAGWYRPLFGHWSRLFVAALGVDLRLVRHFDGPLPARFLLIANHPSAFEDIGIPALFDVDSLAKIEVRGWWLVGRISAAAGTLYVHRESRESRRAAGRMIAARLAAGRSVALYPEGGVLGKRVHPFRHGAFRIAIEAGVPILPVFIHYRPEEEFYWGDQTLVQKIGQIMRARDPRADFHLFAPIEPAGFADAEAFATAVHARYLAWQREYLESAAGVRAGRLS